MKRTVLIDLDDTLLNNSMDLFLPAYFEKLGSFLSDLVEPERMLGALMAGTRAMLNNQDPTKLLERLFADVYYPELDLDEAALRDRIRFFYQQIFPELEILTSVNPSARPFVEALLESGHEVVIATNPLFPSLAIEARLHWAGIPVGGHDFSLVTSYENFHFTKPNPAYFTEILGLLGRPLSDAVMIGNDVAADLEPADLLGLPVFHLHERPVSHFPGGDFDTAREWLQRAWDDVDQGGQQKPEVILARFKGHLAALLTLADRTSASSAWRKRPVGNEWAPIEICAHLADVEGEVNLPRLEQFKSAETPHLTAIDTDIWAVERAYIDYEPQQTIDTFVHRRLSLIDSLQHLGSDQWQQEGIHALLGPTTLAEVMRIAADHDLLHLAQMRATIGYPP